MSRSKHKKLFWVKNWRHNRTPEQWLENIDPKRSHPRYAIDQRNLLLEGLDKLLSAKKILPDEKINMEKMICSPDHENALVAITIMATLKPNKFKKIKN